MLQQTIKYSFRDETLLERALTHSSYTNEQMWDRTRSYERLEFLGDSVLSLIACNYLYRTYPVGSLLAVRLQGLAIDEYNGVLRVGLQPDKWDYRSTLYMSHAAVADRHIYRTLSVEPPTPERLVAGELTRRLCGRLVTVVGVQADDEASTWADGEYTCYRKFRDAQGDSIYVQTSPYARFARHALPTEELSLTGILYYGAVEGSRKAFIIKMNDEKGVGH